MPVKTAARTWLKRLFVNGPLWLLKSIAAFIALAVIGAPWWLAAIGAMVMIPASLAMERGRWTHHFNTWAAFRANDLLRWLVVVAIVIWAARSVGLAAYVPAGYAGLPGGSDCDVATATLPES